MSAALITTVIIPAAFVADLIFGDPVSIPHPVVIIGKLISYLEKKLRAIFSSTERGEFFAGLVMAKSVMLLTLSVSLLISSLLLRISPILFGLVQLWWCWQCLAVKSLSSEGKNIYRSLKSGSLEDSRAAVARVVGRDTSGLKREEIIKAAIETIAENFTDGVVAPMMYMSVFGAPLALMYKAVNTMDSMVGYKNEKYLFFGRVAAKIDDFFNYLPARTAAIIWILSSGMAGFSMRDAYGVWKRDRRKHASPNSAQTEAACAGALGIRLAGPACYFGKYYDKQYIGDNKREPEPEDIMRTDRIMRIGALIASVLFTAARLIIILSVN